jgi:hypothetical protein
MSGYTSTKMEFVAPTPKYPESAENQQAAYKVMIHTQKNNELNNLNRKLARTKEKINNADHTDND